MAIAWRAGRPVITATARTTSASSSSAPGAAGVQAGRLGVVDDRGQRAVEVETDDDAVEDVAYGVVVGARVVGGELHGISQPRARARAARTRSTATRPGSARGVGGEDDR